MPQFPETMQQALLTILKAPSLPAHLQLAQSLMFLLPVSEEERMMTEMSGDAYKAYMQRTRRLIQ